MKRLILIAGILLLFAVEIGKVYFIMPFPGSQKADTIDLAYWIDNNILWIRILIIGIIIFPFISAFRKSKTGIKIFLSAVLVLYGVIFYLFNFRFLADKMFYQPGTKQFLSAGSNTVKEDKLVIALMLNGEAKAYPIQLIGYHHQVTDTVGGTPVMVTYCTVCRTGRVFSPVVKGKPENFRLVGMDHFNAMFEDATTKSWWQQATGKAIAGKLKGTTLKEIASVQMTLAAWLKQYPTSLVMQPDTVFNSEYNSLAEYDRGTVKSKLEKRDSASWQFKSWVVGISDGDNSRAYDWNHLVQQKLIQDSLPGLPVLLVLEQDTASFYAYNRNVGTQTLQFRVDSSAGTLNETGTKPKDPGARLKDVATSSTWNLRGTCVDGALKGTQLKTVQVYQEFWHSWQTFHPTTLKYE